MKSEKEKESCSQSRNEKEGLLNFSKEMISALGTALIFIIYVIQAFVIPTGSMEQSLKVGDFLLGVKFIYGAPLIPFTQLKLPGLKDPQRGEVVIFKYPGPDNKDYIKRCVAVAGDSVEIRGKRLIVNGQTLAPPPESQFLRDGVIGGDRVPHLDRFKPLYIPRGGDTIFFDDDLSLRDFFFYKRLVQQELSYKRVRDSYKMLVDGVDRTDMVSSYLNRPRFKEWDSDPNFFWFHYELYFNSLIDQIMLENPDREVEIVPSLYVDDFKVDHYVVENDNYFMLGDNRDNSADSRFWGFVNKKSVKAQAFVVYFSLDRERDSYGREVIPWYLLPFKIRWNRLGTLIRSWDGGYIETTYEESI